MTKKILLIDDDPNIVTLLKSRLESAGYSVVSAHDGVKGLDLARKRKPDLIIVDVIMPNIDGYQFCLLLRSDERCKKIPVIMLTSMNEKMDRMTGKALGADEYITKPFDSAKLFETVKTMLERASSQNISK